MQQDRSPAFLTRVARRARGTAGPSGSNGWIPGTALRSGAPERRSREKDADVVVNPPPSTESVESAPPPRFLWTEAPGNQLPANALSQAVELAVCQHFLPPDLELVSATLVTTPVSRERDLRWIGASCQVPHARGVPGAAGDGRCLGVDVHSDQGLVSRIPVADLLAVRFAIASLALGLIVGPRIKISRDVLTKGALLGLLYGSAQILQTAGLAHTAASVSGFVTGLYVVATPLLDSGDPASRIASMTWLRLPCHDSGSPSCRCAGSASATGSCSPS